MSKDRPEPTPTAMGLIAMTPQKKTLESGQYITEYIGFELRRSKEGCRQFYLHSFRVIDHAEHSGQLIQMCTSIELIRSANPKYNSKLYKLVSALMERDLESNEEINLKTLKGKNCKLVLDTENGIENVTGIFKQSANIGNPFGEWQEFE